MNATVEFNFVDRFTFTGGTNVTLRGSTDPNWGWVDAHGQAVSISEFRLLFQTDCLDSDVVVGRRPADQPPAWLGFQQDHQRGHS